MKLTSVIFFPILLAVFLTACSSTGSNTSNTNSANRSANSANTNTSVNPIKDDVDELEMVIKLPLRPEEVVWREEPTGNAGGKKLIAVLRYLKDNADKVVAQAEKYKAAAPETINTENWFPDELIAQSQMSGDKTIKGSSYPATDFINPPYTDGKITRIAGTDYFVLELLVK